MLLISSNETIYLQFMQLPLDLSPLATPIIRNKIEEPTAMEANRDSPLPHPESTTNDDKVNTCISFKDDYCLLFQY